jgi:transcriptional regulator
VNLVEGEDLEAMLRQLMSRYESAHAETPQSFEEIPEKTLKMDLRALIGFEIKIERIEAASKLSQNRDAESHKNIVKHLKEIDAYDSKRIAEEMISKSPSSNKPE